MASKPPDYQVTTIQDICRAQSARPVPVIHTALSAHEPTLVLTSSETPMKVKSTQPLDFQCLFLSLELQLGSLQHLAISGYSLTSHELHLLSAGLASNSTLETLNLQENEIADSEGIAAFAEAVAGNQRIEKVVLARNRCGIYRIDDSGAAALAGMLEVSQSLRLLDLSENQITKGDLALALTKYQPRRNSSLEHFSISGNPLQFEALIAFLEMLSTSHSLEVLEIENCPQEGPAPLKENASGHLSKSEAVILVLSYVLRYSTVRSLAVDIDQSAEVQLQELESTVVKHNRSLIDLRSRQIDFTKIRPSHPLHTIFKAIKANKWLCDNDTLPRDQLDDPESSISDIVSAKQRFAMKRSTTPDSAFSDSSYRSVEQSLSQRLIRDPESAAKIRIEDYDEESPQKKVDTPHFTTLSARKRAAKLQSHLPTGEEDDLISQAYGIQPAEHPGHSLERETKLMEELIGFETNRSETHPRDTELTLEPDKSLISASVFADTPRNFQYSESSSAETPIQVESPRAALGNSDLATVLKLVNSLNASFQRLEAEVSKGFAAVNLRMKKVEERTLQQGQELRDLAEFVEDVDRRVKTAEERVEVSCRQKAEFEVSEATVEVQRTVKAVEDRVALLEKKESAKVALFEELGNELDVLFTQSLRSLVASLDKRSSDSLSSISTALERRFQSQVDRLLQRLEELEQTMGEPQEPKQDLAELTGKVDDLISIREGKEEEILLILNKITTLESREEQIEKLKYFVSMLQKDLTSRLARLETRVDTEESVKSKTHKMLEARLQQLEETSRSLVTEHRDAQDSSIANSPPLTLRSRTSAASIPQVTRLEERVADLEKDQNNVAFVKKRLIDTMVRVRQKRVKLLERRIDKRPNEHICETENEDVAPTPDFSKGKRVVRKTKTSEFKGDETFERADEGSEEKPQMEQERQEPVEAPPSFSPISSAASLTLSKLRTDQAPENLDDRIARLEKLHIHKKAAMASATEEYCVFSKETEPSRETFRTEHTLLKELGNGYLPGEAESVVMNALLERTQKSKGSVEAARAAFVPAYRSLSPLSGSFVSLANYSQGSVSDLRSPDELATREAPEGPSMELQEYLRTKGFRFPDAPRKL